MHGFRSRSADGHRSADLAAAFAHKNEGRTLAQFCLDGRVAFGMTVETGSGSLDHFNLSCQFAAGTNPPVRAR